MNYTGQNLILCDKLDVSTIHSYFDAYYIKMINSVELKNFINQRLTKPIGLRGLLRHLQSAQDVAPTRLASFRQTPPRRRLESSILIMNLGETSYSVVISG